MSEDGKVKISFGGDWIATALLLIAFWGEPDLVDCLKTFLTGGQ
jgi:hypothetical protein